MPRVKLVYQGDGEWASATTRIGECKHPREVLRFDGSLALPVAMYCRACGTRYISPSWGLTKEQIEKAREEAAEIREKLGWGDGKENP